MKAEEGATRRRDDDGFRNGLCGGRAGNGDMQIPPAWDWDRLAHSFLW